VHGSGDELMLLDDAGDHTEPSTTFATSCRAWPLLVTHVSARRCTPVWCW
jgi:hypothetical protein